MQIRICSRLSDYVILQDIVYLLIRYAQVAHGYGRVGMVKPLADDFVAYAVLLALDIAPGLSECVRTVIALKVYRAGPALYHCVNGLYRYGFVSLAALK